MQGGRQQQTLIQMVGSEALAHKPRIRSFRSEIQEFFKLSIPVRSIYLRQTPSPPPFSILCLCLLSSTPPLAFAHWLTPPTLKVKCKVWDGGWKGRYPAGGGTGAQVTILPFGPRFFATFSFFAAAIRASITSTVTGDRGPLPVRQFSPTGDISRSS